jgi:hypothetical protein
MIPYFIGMLSIIAVQFSDFSPTVKQIYLKTDLHLFLNYETMAYCVAIVLGIYFIAGFFKNNNMIKDK